MMHALVISGTVSTAKGGPSGYLLDQAIRASR
jgi:hypothetical protein